MTYSVLLPPVITLSVSCRNMKCALHLRKWTSRTVLDAECKVVPVKNAIFIFIMNNQTHSETDPESLFKSATQKSRWIEVLLALN
jgi:hypothetical protein